jgi:hypothetical protein
MLLFELCMIASAILTMFDPLPPLEEYKPLQKLGLFFVRTILIYLVLVSIYALIDLLYLTLTR